MNYCSIEIIPNHVPSTQVRVHLHIVDAGFPTVVQHRSLRVPCIRDVQDVPRTQVTWCTHLQQSVTVAAPRTDLREGAWGVESLQ